MACCSLSSASLRLCGLFAFYIIYLCIGAAVFSAIEYDNEKKIIELVQTKRREFLERNKKCLTDNDLELLISRVVQANNRGISAITDLKVSPNWSFGQAIFFSGTVLTTIGYGHISPLSPAGKIFCIFFALFGIPLTLVMMSACVERLLLITDLIREWMKEFSLFRRGSCQELDLSLVNFCHLTLVFSTVLFGFFIVPAAVFSYIEPEWDYLDALYYCFISLTTIGLGDYIPGDDKQQSFKTLYKIATTFYLIIGVMSVMLVVKVVSQVPQLNLTQFFSSDSNVTDPERQILTHTPCHRRHSNETNEDIYSE